MKLRRIRDGGETLVQAATGPTGSQGWVALSAVLPRLSQRPSEADAALWSRDLVAFLGAPGSVRVEAERIAAQLPPDSRPDATVLIPFEPRSFRDFMLYEATPSMPRAGSFAASCPPSPRSCAPTRP